MKNNNIKIVSFNMNLIPFVRHPYIRVREFSRQTEVINADIINLQEVHSYDMLWQLHKRLTEFPYILYKSGLLGPKAGLVTFSKEFISTNFFESLSPRKGIIVSQLKSGIIVVNVHLVANTDGDWSKSNRFYLQHMAQLDKLNEVTNRLIYKNQPIILSGDFNLAKTSDLYRYFIKKGGWNDTSPLDFAPTFHSDFLPHSRKPQRIDYIFVKDGFQVLKTSLLFRNKVKGLYLSDHLGVFVELKPVLGNLARLGP